MQVLDDLFIVDLSRVLAGPFCTALLSDYGARVLKIERPQGGDDTRGYGPPFLSGESAYFLSLNRNKESLALDFSHPRGREILDRLIARADVLVENFRPGVLARMGLGPEDTLKGHPRLIYCSISGFGHAGVPEWATKPGYDLVIQGMGGLMSLTGPPDGEPMRAGLPIADLFAGVFAALGVLLGLRARERTGKGQHVDVSLLDGQVSILSYAAGIYFATGRSPERPGNAHPTIVPYEPILARDGHITIAAANDSLFKKLCEVIGRMDLCADARFATNKARVIHRETLLAQLRPLFAARTVAEWLALLESAGVPCGPILDVAGALEHPQVAARGMVKQIKHPVAGNIRVTSAPVTLSETPGALRQAPPTLGQHSTAILQELGISDHEAQLLRDAGVVC